MTFSMTTLQLNKKDMVSPLSLLAYCSLHGLDPREYSLMGVHYTQMVSLGDASTRNMRASYHFREEQGVSSPVVAHKYGAAQGFGYGLLHAHGTALVSPNESFQGVKRILTVDGDEYQSLQDEDLEKKVVNVSGEVHIFPHIVGPWITSDVERQLPKGVMTDYRLTDVTFGFVGENPYRGLITYKATGTLWSK